MFLIPLTQGTEAEEKEGGGQEGGMLGPRHARF